MVGRVARGQFINHRRVVRLGPSPAAAPRDLGESNPLNKTITVKSIRADELERFGNADRSSDFWDRFRLRRQREWAEGRSSPALCFVAEADGQIVGRLVYGGDGDLSLGFFEVPWGQDDYLQVGTELLRQSCALLLRRGHRSLSLQVGSEVPNSDKRRQVLEAAGIGLWREKVIFTAPAESAAVTRLRFEGLDRVGKDRFIEAMVQVNEGCLDADIKKRLDAAANDDERLAIAQEQFADFGAGYGATEQLWELAFYQDQCVGLSMPGLFSSEKPDDAISGTICYIGVAVGHRGHGFGRDLLLRLTERLYDVGAEHVWADTESTNGPMIWTFTAAGWQENGRNFQYRADLSDVCA